VTDGVIFVENYIAGGSDRIARLLAERLGFSRLTLMVNVSNDDSILLADGLPPHVTVDYYGLATLPDLLAKARACRVRWMRVVLRLVVVALRYPLFVFSIIYFRRRIARTGATTFLANNGGYPAGDYCRSATIAASLISGVRAFHVVHSLAKAAPRLFSIPEWAIDRAIDRRSRIIAVCHAAAQRLQQVRWFKQSIAIAYNGLDSRGVPVPAKDRDEFKILNVGYFDRNKNQAMLIRAAARLIKGGHRHIRLVFLGAETSDGMQAECRRLTDELGIAESVAFAGFAPDAAPWYDDCDAYVLCSDWEGLPLTIIEAMRAGRAVIATASGGVAELVTDGVTGYTVPPGDEQALAGRLAQLSSDRDTLRRFGEAGRRAFEAQFTVDHMIRTYARIIDLPVVGEARATGRQADDGGAGMAETPATGTGTKSGGSGAGHRI
jgi:glycosyltransferase involved in cell wall biosynthesis